MRILAFLVATSPLQITIEATPTIDPKDTESEELSQNRPRCDEKHGRCIPMDAPCRGRAMICCDYCLDEDNFKCCIDICYTYQPCSALGGTCLSQHDECQGIGVNVENGCSVENSLNCTCCVPHSKRALIKNWEKAKELIVTVPKSSNQISPNTKKHSRTGKDLHPDTMTQLKNEHVNEEMGLMVEKGRTMDELENEGVYEENGLMEEKGDTMDELENEGFNEETFLLEEKDETTDGLTSEEVNELVNEETGLIEEKVERREGLTSKDEISEDLDTGGSNEFFVDESELLKDEKGLTNNVNIFSIEEYKIEDENNGNDDLSSEVEEIIAENNDFNESIEGKENNHLNGVDDENDNINTENEYLNDEKVEVDKNEEDLDMLISTNEELNNDYSFINDKNENDEELNIDYSFSVNENENNEHSENNVEEDADHIEHNYYKNENKDENKNDNEGTEINSIEDDKSSEYDEK